LKNINTGGAICFSQGANWRIACLDFSMKIPLSDSFLFPELNNSDNISKIQAYSEKYQFDTTNKLFIDQKF
jgi:hypothetical protein